MKKKNLLYILSFTLLFFYSCSDEWLKEDPKSLYDLEKVFSSNETVVQAVNAITAPHYYGADGGGVATGNFFAWVLAQMGHDLGSPTKYKGNAGADKFSQGLFNASDNEMSRPWITYYKCIGRANSVIQNIEKATMSDEELRNRCYGEALIWRAHYYFQLVRTFGNVPIILRLPENTDELLSTEVKDSPAEEVWTQIINDLLLAEKVMSDGYNGNKGNLTRKHRVYAGELARPGIGVVHGLLAKVYLHRGDYANALKYANKVIGTGNTLESVANPGNEYYLSLKIQDIWGFDKDTGPEWMLSLPSSGENFQSNQYASFFAQSGLTNKTLWYSNLPFYTALGGVPGAASVDSALYNKLWESKILRDNDYRRSQLIWDTVSWNDKGVKTLFKSPLPMLTKFFDYANPNSKLNARQNRINMGFLRYSDIVLVAAEAEAEVGNQQRAVDLVNIIRLRAAINKTLPGILITSVPDKSQLINIILDERRKELIGEYGDRYFDIQRRRLIESFVKKLPYTNAWNENYYLLPKPAQEVLKSEGRIKQNNGWL
jgi:hypothetical protein